MYKIGEIIESRDGKEKLWLVKDMNIYRKYDKKYCYVVLGFAKNSNGWYTLFNGSLQGARKYIAIRREVTKSRFYADCLY